MRTLAWALPAVLLALYGCGRAVAQNPRGSAVARGDELARLVCSDCHVVATDQDFPPVLQPPAPSFPDIANRPGTTAKSLQHFILTTHWDMKSTPITMPNPRMRPEDAAALAAYILSLKKPAASPPRGR
ncbi:MAG TPA: c-type cytochrome [Steroidobacteraceae bacterium]|nr:c-type cytochrome [Steroidobacteraceae bacterium]